MKTLFPDQYRKKHNLYTFLLTTLFVIIHSISLNSKALGQGNNNLNNPQKNSRNFEYFKQTNYFLSVFNSNESQILDTCWLKTVETENIIKEIELKLDTVLMFRKLNQHIQASVKEGITYLEGINKLTKIIEYTKIKSELYQKKTEKLQEDLIMNKLSESRIYVEKVQELNFFATKYLKDGNNLLNTGLLMNVDTAKVDLNFLKNKYINLKNGFEFNQDSAFYRVEHSFGLYNKDTALIRMYKLIIRVKHIKDTISSYSESYPVYSFEFDRKLYKTPNALYSQLTNNEDNKKFMEMLYEQEELSIKRLEQANNKYDRLYNLRIQAEKNKQVSNTNELINRADQLETEAIAMQLQTVNDWITINKGKFFFYKETLNEIRKNCPVDNKKQLATYEQQGYNYYQTFLTKHDEAMFYFDQAKYRMLMRANESLLLANQAMENALNTCYKINETTQIVDKEPILKQKPIIQNIESTEAKDNNQGNNKKKNVKEGKEKQVVNLDKLKPAGTFQFADGKSKEFKHPKGTFYRIQVGDFREMVTQNEVNNIKPIIYTKYTGVNLMRFYVGEFSKNQDVENALKTIKDKGFAQAKIITFINGNPNDYKHENKKEDNKELKKKENTSSTIKANKETKNEHNQNTKKISDVKSIKGVVYLIQLGNYTLPKTTDEMKKYLPIYENKLADGTFRYLKGNYTSKENAEKELTKIKKEFPDAFVVVYKDGNSISFSEAQKQIKTNYQKDKIAFKVQIGAYSEEMPHETKMKFAHLTAKYPIEKFKNIKSLNVYTMGNFDNYQDAESLKEQLKKDGLVEGNIIAFHDNKEIPLTDAIEACKK